MELVLNLLALPALMGFGFLLGHYQRMAKKHNAIFDLWLSRLMVATIILMFLGHFIKIQV